MDRGLVMPAMVMAQEPNPSLWVLGFGFSDTRIDPKASAQPEAHPTLAVKSYWNVATHIFSQQ